MNKTIALAALFMTLAWPIHADIGTDFQNRVITHPWEDLKGYTQDINSLLGMNDFHTAEKVNFPGLDVGVNFNAVKPGAENHVTTSKYLSAGFITLETALPIVGMHVAARGTSYDGFQSIGGGLKMGFSLLDLVDVSVSGFYDRAKTDWYTVDHLSASATASVDILFLTPYVGIGYDYGELKTTDLPVYKTSKTGGMRYTAGLKITPLPFVYAFAAITKTPGDYAAQVGAGVRF